MKSETHVLKLTAKLRPGGAGVISAETPRYDISTLRWLSQTWLT